MGLLERIARARLGGQVIRRLRRAGFTDARYDARGFRVRFTAEGDDTPTILELAPLLAARGGRRRHQVDRFVAGLVTPRLPLGWAEARPLLRPVLRGGTPGSPLRRPVLPFLYEYVVVDQPETMTYVGPEQPAAWGVKSEEVFAAARANLSGAVLQGVAHEPVVVRFVDDGDAYWTSHLLLEHWLERLSEQVGGVPVAFAPERGTLLVTADGSEHLPGLFAQAEEIYATSTRPITPMAYGYDDHGCTVPYVAPPGHPLHQAVRRAERVLAVHEYARQATQETTERATQEPTETAAQKLNQQAARETDERAARTPDEPRVQPPNEPHAQTPDEPHAPANEPHARTPDEAPQPANKPRAQPVDEPQAQPANEPHAKTPDQAHARANEPPARTLDDRATPAPAGRDAREVNAWGFMAEMRLVGSAEQGWHTRAFWERDEPVLLPEADEVQIGDQICGWREVLPRLRRAEGFEPARWAGDRWPPG